MKRIFKKFIGLFSKKECEWKYFFTYKKEQEYVETVNEEHVFFIITYGCDGKCHAFEIDKVWEYDGKVTFAEQKERGFIFKKCDGSCKGRINNNSFFGIQKKIIN